MEAEMKCAGRRHPITVLDHASHRMVFQQKVNEKEAKLKQSEEEVRCPGHACARGIDVAHSSTPGIAK
jgi:hypothetical protein